MPQTRTPAMFDRRVLLRGAGICLAFLLCFGLLYWIVADQWKVQAVSTDPISPDRWFGDVQGELTVEQALTSPMDAITNLTFWPVRNGGRENGGVTVELLGPDGVSFSQTLPAESLPDNEAYTLAVPEGAVDGVKGVPLTLRLTVRGQNGLLPVNFAYGSKVEVGRYTLDSQADLTLLSGNGQPVRGVLYYALEGYNHWHALPVFAGLMGAALLALVLGIFRIARKSALQQGSAVLSVFRGWRKYHFLLQQLVARDFKIKYKRSSLGLLWSFFNPLLTMLVQYLVFSTLFQSSIRNFPLYLLSGIVLFGFFNESVASGMESITANASLINKVYVPKLIYPVSKVLSALINLLISFILLLGAMVLSGAPFTKSMLLLPIPISLLILFCLGMTFLLATLNVFFRDMKFLWGVVSLIWRYLTPICYPDSIIPAFLQPVYRINPLYQYISFIRAILIDGVSPQPVTYLWSAFYAVLALGLGLWVFRRQQDRFIQYL